MVAPDASTGDPLHGREAHRKTHRFPRERSEYRREGRGSRCCACSLAVGATHECPLTETPSTAQSEPVVTIGSRPPANANGPDMAMLIFEPEAHRVAAPKMSAAFLIYHAPSGPFAAPVSTFAIVARSCRRRAIGPSDDGDGATMPLDAPRSLPLELIRKIPALLLLHRTLLALARKPIMGVYQSGAGPVGGKLNADAAQSRHSKSPDSPYPEFSQWTNRAMTSDATKAKTPHTAPWLNWIEQPPPKGQVAGSNPAGVAMYQCSMLISWQNYLCR